MSILLQKKEELGRDSIGDIVPLQPYILPVWHRGASRAGLVEVDQGGPPPNNHTSVLPMTESSGFETRSSVLWVVFPLSFHEIVDTKAQLNKKRSAGSHSRSTSRCSSPTSSVAPVLNDTSRGVLNLKDSWGLKLVQSGSSDTNTRTLAEPSDTLLEHLFFEEEGDDEISDMDVDVERGDALGLKSDQNLPDLEKYLQEGYQVS
ncbi:unnamed protein product [Timema podura]|uniref:Uncharacterized protein n=1 Tax=Timema podura TaxID=61482 RepID=A0ABN7P8L0_TIMPD|nr:unnamed protein product [Timema podura]